MTSLPNEIKLLFWDVDFSKINLQSNNIFIIKRVLDRGNTKNLNWLLDNFTKKDIIQTISVSRDLSQKTANFWSDFYKLDKSKILCLQKHYSPIPFGQSS